MSLGIERTFEDAELCFLCREFVEQLALSREVRSQRSFEMGLKERLRGQKTAKRDELCLRLFQLLP